MVNVSLNHFGEKKHVKDFPIQYCQFKNTEKHLFFLLYLQMASR